MLQVTARVFDNNQLVGYQITDGQQTQLFTKQQAWLYAKNKQLLNVVATGDETNPGLSGTNGFELKRLPEIKWREPQSVKTKFNFNTQDMESACLRNAIKTGNLQRPESRDVTKQYLKADVTNGIVSPQNCRALSHSLLVEKLLHDGKNPAGKLTIGYQLKNIGNQPIEITRMTATPEHSTSQVVLNPGQSICLNRAEMAFLSSKPEVGCRFANGKLVTTSKKTAQSLYQFLADYFFMLTEENGVPAYDMSIDIWQSESPDIVNTYFIPQNQSQADQQKITQAQQAKQNIQQKGLFAGFKR